MEWTFGLRLDAIEIQYGLDGRSYRMMRLAYFSDQTPVMVGLTAASPDGNDFEVLLEHFTVKYVLDQRQLNWLGKPPKFAAQLFNDHAVTG